MISRIFRERSAQALADLLGARELRNFTLTRHCEIGPFVVDYLFPERALIVELGPGPAARLKFLNAMGYGVLTLDPVELLRQPRRALARLQHALRN